MQHSPTGRKSPPWQLWLLGAGVAVVALAPWWRNHRFLRDFYDYGLVISGVARIEAGERPYVDFVTPIQTGLFLFNGWAGKLGGGTFHALTLGAAALTLFGTGLLLVLLARRWPPWVTAGLAAALAAMILSQHTIIWHNAVGALCIAVAALSAAVAPVWRRADWPWHLLTALALVTGGITKLNSHLVAVASVTAWALHAGFQGRETWSGVLRTLGGVAAAAVVAPVALELAWTGAAPGQWWLNVVVLPIGSRSGDLAEALHLKFYLAVYHDYYGPLPVRALGAIGLAVTAIAGVAGIRARGWRQAGWVMAAALFAAGAGASLLATNYEIAYLALGAWFALVAALWLGFGCRSEGPLFWGGFILPVLWVGALAWHSAWLGQRSQFGYSLAPRSDYVDGERIAPDFAYLRGTRVPPETAGSMKAAAAWREAQPAAVRSTVFYGPGLEWLERCWPVLKPAGLPLWMHGGTSYGTAELARLEHELAPSGAFAHVLVTEARDHWEPQIRSLLTRKYVRRSLGTVWIHYEKLTAGSVSIRPAEFVHPFGGNVNATQLFSDMPVQQMSGNRTFVGVSSGQGEMRLAWPSYRAMGEVVLQRAPGQAGTKLAGVHFEIFTEEQGQRVPRWSATVDLPQDQAEWLVPFPVDSGGFPLFFRVTIPPELDGRVFAGWRALRILHSADGPAEPWRMRVEADEAKAADMAAAAALLPGGWAPPAVFVRDGRFGVAGLELFPGGEIWIRLTGAYRDISGVATVTTDQALPGPPVVRVFHVKGARLEVLAQAAMHDLTVPFAFSARSPEPDGWLVIVVDPANTRVPVSIRLQSATLAE